MVEAEVQRPGMMTSSWHISKPVMVLRTYMSNSLLINNSLNNLSRTFEKNMVYGDIEVLIEAAAFSSGDLFYIRTIIEPQLKHTRLEHMEVNVIESRKYCIPEMRAWRTDSTSFPLQFAGSVRLAEFGEVDTTTEQLMPIFDKNQNGIELEHDFAHRLAFYAPTCQQNIRHTTYLKEIQFRHHVEISLTLSYLDIQGNRQHLSRRNSFESVPESISGNLTPPPAAYFNHNSRGGISNNNQRMTTMENHVTWQNVLLGLNKSNTKAEEFKTKDTIKFESTITVFDCRLKEDYGRLPSYFELGVKPTTILKGKKNDKIKITKMKQPKKKPSPYLCSCYYTFCKEMELASQALYSIKDDSTIMPLLDRIPSIPPPDYSA